VQLANIPAHITLHELLRLSKETREALRDALADSESFMKEDGASCPRCHLVQQQVPCITFTPKDMLLKDNRHDRPLYYKGYWVYIYRENTSWSWVCSKHYPKETVFFLGIPLSRLSTITIIIYGFNAGSSHPLGKIRLRCQIEDLKSEVTCYIFDADTSYNLLFVRPSIHDNWIVVASILHQCFKYVNDKEMVRTL